MTEGKKREEERSNIKNIENSELAEKLSSLLTKKTKNEDPRSKIFLKGFSKNIFIPKNSK